MRWLRNKLNKSRRAILILCLIPVMLMTMTGCGDDDSSDVKSSLESAVAKVKDMIHGNDDDADADDGGLFGSIVDGAQDVASFLTCGLIPKSDSSEGDKDADSDDEGNSITNLVLKALPWVGGAILIIIIIVIISNTRKAKYKAQANAAAMSGGIMMNPQMMNPQSGINLNANDMDMFE